MEIKKRPKGAKKKFFEVEVPYTSAKAHLIAYAPEELEGSIIKLDLTKNLRGKSLELRSRVLMKDKKLTSHPLSMNLIQSYVRKFVRKGADYVEDSFETECRDAILRVKPFLVTRNKVSRAVKQSLRELLRKTLESRIKVRDYEEVFSEIMSNKIQKELASKLKKIYPLSVCEIRAIEVIKTKTPETIKSEDSQ